MTDSSSLDARPLARRRTAPWRRGGAAAAGLVTVVLVASACVTATSVAGQTLTITGSSGADTIFLRLQAGDPNVLVVDDGGDGGTDFTFDRSTFNQIVVHGGGGDDKLEIDRSNGSFTDTEATTFTGDDGNDTLIGDVGSEILDGGPGDDVIDGRQNTDIVFAGDGNDVVQWDPGDGSDVVEGGPGTDRLVFDGSNIGEHFDVERNGGRVRLTRDVANITMDLNDVETVNLNAIGGQDLVTAGDVTNTDLTTLDVDFGALGGGDDGSVDEVAVPPGVPISQDGTAAVVGGLGAQVRVRNGSSADRIHVLGTAAPGEEVASILGTAGADTVSVTPDGTDVDVVGATPGVHVQLTAIERLDVGLGAGADTFTSVGNLAPLVVDVDGGPDADTLTGGTGADVITGGTGNDTIDGRQGNDTILAGDGQDVIRWDPGDGNDTVDGGPGADRLVFNGSNIGEQFDVSPNGGRVRLFRNVGAVTTDFDDVETLDLATIGGQDAITVNDLTNTDLSLINLGLGALGGGDDGSADQVTVNGTAGDDTVVVADSGPAIGLFGLHPLLKITGSTVSNDRLTVNGLAGRNNLSSTPGVAALIQLTLVP